MIKINDIEYKNNINLKTIIKKKVLPPSGLSSYSRSDVYNNIFIYNNKLCAFINKFFYYYNGDEWLKFDDTITAPSNSSSYSSDYRLLIYNDDIYMLGRSSSYPKCFKITFNPYTWNELGSIPFSNLGTSAKVYDYCVVGNKIYASMIYSSTYHLCEFNLSNLTFTEKYDWSSYYTNNYRMLGKLINLNDELYITNCATDISDGIPVPSLYKFQNNNIIELCSMPFVINSNSYYPNLFLYNDKLYVTSYNSNGYAYIFEYDSENNDWITKYRYPRSMSTTYSEVFYKYSFDNLGERDICFMTTNITNIDDCYLIGYNGSIHAIKSGMHLIYNENDNTWYNAGYLICELVET